VAVEKKIKVRELKDSGNKYHSLRMRFFCLMGFLVTLSGFFGSNVHAQDRLELGPLVGVSYYFGDLNNGVPFVDSHLALGGIARYVFSDRIAVRGSLILAGISGSYDPEEDGVLPGLSKGYAFSRHIGDAAAMVEINLFSYDHKYIPTTVFTPYLSVGLGTVLYKRIDEGNEKSVFVLSLPFGVGVKYKFSKWFRVGAEWSFRKLFDDDIDGVSNELGDFYGNTWTHNNDWISVVDVYVTFGFLRRRSSCKGGY